MRMVRIDPGKGEMWGRNRYSGLARLLVEVYDGYVQVSGRSSRPADTAPVRLRFPPDVARLLAEALLSAANDADD